MSVVNTNYMYDPGDMHEKEAAAASIAICLSAAWTPGIDLVLYGSAFLAL